MPTNITLTEEQRIAELAAIDANRKPAKVICDEIRNMAHRLATGEKEIEHIPLNWVRDNAEIGFFEKMTQAYVRNTANRCPAVIGSGKSISVRVEKDFELPNGFTTRAYTLTLSDKPASKPKGESKADVARRAASRDIYHLVCSLMPDFSDLSDDEALISMRAVKRHRDMIGKLVGIKEEKDLPS